MTFTRSINALGWTNQGQPGFRPMYRYMYSDALFVAEIYQVWSTRDKWDFTIKLAFDEKKEIAGSIGYGQTNVYKTLKSAKNMVEKLVGLLHRANDTGELWIAKGIMLGFTDVTQMEHLKTK